jgi:hypothetical protein
MLTKNVTVMLLIVLAEAALGWNFVFWSYFVVIFRVGVDVLYRRAIRTSGIFLQTFGIPEISQTFYSFYKNAKYNNNLWEKYLSGSSKVQVAERILDDFDHCVIKRTIHGLYSRKIAPIVSIIHKEIKDPIKISKSKLTLTLTFFLTKKDKQLFYKLLAFWR